MTFGIDSDSSMTLVRHPQDRIPAEVVRGASPGRLREHPLGVHLQRQLVGARVHQVPRPNPGAAQGQIRHQHSICRNVMYSGVRRVHVAVLAVFIITPQASCWLTVG